MLDWKVGDKVVCVFDWSKHREKYKLFSWEFPLENQVYTVRGIVPATDWIGVCIYLEEVHNLKNCAGNTEPRFDASAFRPVKDTTLDIFRSLTKDPYGPINDVGSQWDRTRKVKELT